MYIFSFISYFRSRVIVKWSVLNEKFSVSHWLPTWLLTCYNHFHRFFSSMKPIINLYYGFGYVSVRPSKFKVFWNQYFTTENYVSFNRQFLRFKRTSFAYRKKKLVFKKPDTCKCKTHILIYQKKNHTLTHKLKVFANNKKTVIKNK